MLTFTPEQLLAVNSVRTEFNEAETARASRTFLAGNAAPIPLDAWRRIDSRSAMIQRDVLTVFNRMAAANQTPVGVGDIVSFYAQASDSGEVHVSMDGRSEGNADQATVKYVGTPVPLFDSYARYGWRQMEVMRKGGMMIDTATIGNHQRKVAEKLEDVMLNGLSSIVVNGNTIYGLRNFPERSTATHGLTLATSTGAQWLAAFKTLIDTLIADNAFGRITVFLNYSDWLSASINEFVAGYPKTILQRLQEIQQIAEIVPASKCTANEIIGVANIQTGDWGTILQAMPMVTRPKARLNPEDDYTFGVMAMAAPQLRADFDGRSQIAHLTAS
jgi:uncharacterized linocin/CFP29 family protein